MSWYAIESVDDAIDATRSFLSPIELATWLRLALVSIFVGAGGGGISPVTNLTSSLQNAPSEPAQQEPAPVPTETTAEALPADPTLVAAIVGAVVLGVLLVLGLRLVSETLRLVFYDGLRTETVRILDPAGRRVGQAFRLFVFKLAIDSVVAILFVLTGIVVFSTVSDTVGEPVEFVGILLIAGGAALLFVASKVVKRVTTEFVTPVMVLTDVGVLDGWRRFWPVLRSNVTQFGVYVVVHFLLLLAISIGRWLIAVVVFGVVGIIGGVVGLVIVTVAFGGFSAAAGSTAGIVTLVGLVLVVLVVGFVLMVPINILVLTYVVSYELSVLGAADDTLRLLPEPTDNTGSMSTA